MTDPRLAVHQMVCSHLVSFPNVEILSNSTNTRPQSSYQTRADKTIGPSEEVEKASERKEGTKKSRDKRDHRLMLLQAPEGLLYIFFPHAHIVSTISPSPE
jgi:hypothetical protein